jgi:hypothetical protein
VIVVGSIERVTKYVQSAGGNWEQATRERGYDEIVTTPARAFQAVDIVVSETLKGDAGGGIRVHLPAADSSEFYRMTPNGPEVLVDHLSMRAPRPATGERYLTLLRRRGEEWELVTDGLSSLFRILDGETVSKLGYSLARVRAEVQAK